MVSVQAGKGNNAPSGKHYNINIIGVPKQKNVNFDGGNGARIFVLRTGTTWFYVGADNHFEILDHDATDGVCGDHGTAFPVGEVGTKGTPGIIFPYENDQWKVQIWVRLLGPKNSQAKWTSYYYDTDGSIYVLYDSFTLTKDTKFQMKTGALLKDGCQDMLWSLDPITKYRICQMRIYIE